jgi:AraC-like DNA-binding protein
MQDYPKIYLYRRVVQAKLFIDDHFAENIDLDNIADEAYFSKFHFIRLFKSIYNKTPHQYLIQVRIEKAKLLLATEISVSDVCFSIGFTSMGSFSSLFKRVVGISPSHFQVEQQQRKADIKLRPLDFIPNCFAENKGWTKNSNFQEAH